MTRQHAISRLQSMLDSTAYHRGFAPPTQDEFALTIAIRELRALAKKRRAK